MKPKVPMALLGSAVLLSLFVPPQLSAQACKDEEGIAVEFKKGTSELVETVKKESLENFQKSYHQKNCLNKLTFSLMAVSALVECLDKAAQDPNATKEQAEAAKAKRATYDQLKAKIEHDRDALKAIDDPKAAKDFIEKIELPK